MPESQPTPAVVEACKMLAGDDAVATRDVARAVGLSNSYFQRCFKKQLGITPQQYRRRVLAERGRDALFGARSVTESIYDAGYGASSRFYEGVGKELGMRPSVARAGGAGEAIRYAVTSCSLGRLLVAWTPRGVCDVAFGDDDATLLSRLGAHFPKADVESSDEHEWVRAVAETVEIGEPAKIPLDIRGTAFQERVWQLLRQIPVGETRTYSELAAELGNPGSTRAVARACASNRLAVLIPCHRVIRKDGELSGYRWGVDRKRKLLAREAAVEKK